MWDTLTIIKRDEHKEKRSGIAPVICYLYKVTLDIHMNNDVDININVTIHRFVRYEA